LVKHFFSSRWLEGFSVIQFCFCEGGQLYFGGELRQWRPAPLVAHIWRWGDYSGVGCDAGVRISAFRKCYWLTVDVGLGCSAFRTRLFFL